MTLSRPGAISWASSLVLVSAWATSGLAQAPARAAIMIPNGSFEFVAVDSEFLRRRIAPITDTTTRTGPNPVAAFYDSLATWVVDHGSQLFAALPGEPEAPVMARQVALSMAAYSRQLSSAFGDAGTKIRDSGMAANLDFVLDVLHPDKKVIVWAHNFHIQHRGFGSQLPDSILEKRLRTMGTWVAERRRHELYTVGFYMYRGTAAYNNGEPYRVRSAAPGSLEAILHRSAWKYSFVDLSRVEETAGTAWMRQPIVAKEWGTSPVTIVPREEYDGLIFIDTTWPPDYVRTP